MAKDSIIEGESRISAQKLFEESKLRKVIPCSLSIDIGLNGGVPLGCSVIVAGLPKLGKTTLSLQYAANAQNLYGAKVFYFNIEGRLTAQVLGQIRGLKQDEVEIITPPMLYKDDVPIGRKKWTAQEWWKEIISTIESNTNAVMIIDSLAALSSEKETSEGMGYEDRGKSKQLESQFSRIYGSLIVANQITVFFLTQVIANTSGYGPQMQYKTGNAIKHLADIIIFGRKSEKWAEHGGKILGHDMCYHVETSALGAPHMDIAVPLRYGYGIDDIKDVVTTAVSLDIINNAGAWFTLPYVKVGEDKFEYKPYDSAEEKSKDRVKLQGEVAVRNWFSVNKDQLHELERMIRGMIFGT